MNKENHEKYSIQELCSIINISCDKEFEAKIQTYLKDMSNLMNTIPVDHTEEIREVQIVSSNYSSIHLTSLDNDKVFANGNVKLPYFFSRRSVKD